MIEERLQQQAVRMGKFETHSEVILRHDKRPEKLVIPAGSILYLLERVEALPNISFVKIKVKLPQEFRELREDEQTPHGEQEIRISRGKWLSIRKTERE